ncbi:hypothetical protein LNP04_09430 [Chryseobacterium sp. C-71]|uniref:hypothetical protein n=1 Tax=Chryseobacterium sp. C-71 TaxID=2893882 RepID=UPI001E2D6BB8|nr:hypothetical protein [Chryseobacterium sp. C-71]UFH33897.1 hypothetical protein LNP04_09430 [Chryseobacterium sp. C-71]
MKNKLFLRLCLIVVVLSFNSCRQDLLPEKETYNNSSAFQLTSKRVSLNESKHKAQLFPEIENAEAKFKAFAKNNAQGKIVNYANGVSIDTDNVIYIENGANFHTYTFNIKRANAPETAPLENLLLIPETDGSYKEFLVTYNLTLQEREKVRNGEPVNTEGKTTITELAKGSFNSGGQLAKMTCNWTEETIWQGCSHVVNGVSMHNQSNVSEWYLCKADVKPSVYTVITGGCNMGELPEHIAPVDGGSGPGGGAGGNGHDPCTSVASGPGQVGIIDSNGCSPGAPTQPNDPNQDNRTPCEVLRDNSADPVFQGKLDSLKNRVTTYNDKHETSITVKKTKNISYKVSATPVDIGFSGTMSVKLDLSPYDIAQMHNHVKDYLPMFSFGDIVAYYQGYQYLVASRKPIYVSYVTSENGTTYAIKFNDPSFLNTLFAGLDLDNTEQEKVAKEKMKKLFKRYGEDENPYTQIRAEELLIDVLNSPEMGGGNGIHIYRKDGNNWGKLSCDADGIINKENCTFN